jgi:predicted metal-dependent hydrolase
MSASTDWVDDAGLASAIADAGLPEGLPWRLVVSGRRRTIGLSVDPGGLLTIQVPAGVQPWEASYAIRKRLAWIVRTTTHQTGIAADHPVKEMVDGESFPFLGRNRRLLVGAPNERVRLLGDRLAAPSGHPAATARKIVFWYAAEGREWLAERLPHWSQRLGVSAASTDVRDLGLRWGMCSEGKHAGIAFHWALFQLPPHLVDFVVVHEVAHLVAGSMGGVRR